MSTDVNEFLGDLDGGVFMQKLSQAIDKVALGVVTHDKTGKVVITLDIAHLGSGSQVNVKHKLNYVAPTHKGKAGEENITETVMYADGKGALTLFPEGAVRKQDQGHLFGKDDKSQKQE